MLRRLDAAPHHRTHFPAAAPSKINGLMRLWGDDKISIKFLLYFIEMKSIPDTPSLEQIYRLPTDRFQAVLGAARMLDDEKYLHWDKLRHLAPPDGLTSLEWWLALKFRRAGGQILIPELAATGSRPLLVSRHARVEAGLARLDRLLAGRMALPDAALSATTRDQFVSSSLMEEAIHSSLFEGAVSTREAAKDMLRSQRAPINRDERMILNNYRAMTRLREMAQSPLSLDMILELHRIMTEGTLDDPDDAGRLQLPGEDRVHIVDNRLNRIVYSPPPAEELPERMERLVEFANADDIVGDRYIHPVLRSILLHFQLAYDHPFLDGNGRTARALFYWSMLRRGFWLAEFFSISRLLYKHRHPYELAYQQVESDEQDGTYFVLQQLDVLQRSVDELFDYVERKNRAQAQLRRRLRARADLNHRQLAVLDHALRHPDHLYTHESHANSHRITTMTARSDLLGLVARGWLEKSRSGKQVIYQPVAGLENRLDG
jgi:Fic family protein